MSFKRNLTSFITLNIKKINIKVDFWEGEEESKKTKQNRALAGECYISSVELVVFAKGQGDQGSIPGRIKSKTKKKWYLILLCLTLTTIS